MIQAKAIRTAVAADHRRHRESKNNPNEKTSTMKKQATNNHPFSFKIGKFSNTATI